MTTRTGRGIVANPRRLDQRRGWAFAFCVAIVKPLSLLFTKRRWSGGENIPATGGCVVVVNHLSHLDPFTFAHFLYDCGRIVAVPGQGRAVRPAGARPDRPQRQADPGLPADQRRVTVVLARPSRRSSAGECVVVYPEGTITRAARPVADDRQDRGRPDRAGLRRAR